MFLTWPEENDRLETGVFGDVELHVTQTLDEVAELSGVSGQRLDVDGRHPRPRCCGVEQRTAPVNTAVTLSKTDDQHLTP